VVKAPVDAGTSGSNVNKMSFSGVDPGASKDGLGLSTIDGVLECLILFSDGIPGLSAESPDAAGMGFGCKIPSSLGLEGSQLMPGLTMRFTVSPSWMLYSLSSLVSARAFPLIINLCASAGGEVL